MDSREEDRRAAQDRADARAAEEFFSRQNIEAVPKTKINKAPRWQNVVRDGVRVVELIDKSGEGEYEYHEREVLPGLIRRRVLYRDKPEGHKSYRSMSRSEYYHVTASGELKPLTERGVSISSKQLAKRSDELKASEVSLIEKGTDKVLAKYISITNKDFREVGFGKTIKDAELNVLIAKKMNRAVQTADGLPDMQKVDRAIITANVVKKAEVVKNVAKDAIAKAAKAVKPMTKKQRIKHKRAIAKAKKLAAQGRIRAKGGGAKRKYIERGKRFLRGVHSIENLAPSAYITSKGYVAHASVKTASDLRKKNIAIMEKYKTGSYRVAAQKAAAKAASDRQVARDAAKEAAKEVRRQARIEAAKEKAKIAKELRDKVDKRREKERARMRKIYDARKEERYQKRLKFAREHTAKTNKARRQKLLSDTRRDLRSSRTLLSEHMRSRTYARGDRKFLHQNVSHALKYPKMYHASTRASIKGVPHSDVARLPSKVSLTSLGRVESLMPIMGDMGFGTVPTLYTTDSVMTGVPHNLGDPQGIVFNVDTTQVDDAFMNRFPDAIKTAFKNASGKTAKLMLDMIEPYVPKDTGRMYSTAEDLSGKTMYDDSFHLVQGATIGYRTPYANLVYFDMNKRHGAEYNAFYGPGLRGEKETARWIEVAITENQGDMDKILQANADEVRKELVKIGRSLGYKKFARFSTSAGLVSFYHN